MATYYITNTSQLNALLTQKVAKGLLEYVSKKVVKVMQDNLNQSEISTNSLQDCVSYKINDIGTESIIEIDYFLAQTDYATSASYEGNKMVEWGRFRNSIGNRQFNGDTWNGKYISFKIAEWLEDGGPDGYGNQPIQKSSWFTKTKAEVQSNLSIWAKQYLSKYGLI